MAEPSILQLSEMRTVSGQAVHAASLRQEETTQRFKACMHSHCPDIAAKIYQQSYFSITATRMHTLLAPIVQ